MPQDFDLVIIGGGINGAALARLASYQGLKVALFEGGDFGQGASTATSKLIHGGLRYLENFDFSLVRGSVRERLHLLHTAPHLVEERRFLFPDTKLGRHFRLAVKAGMWLYDFLAGKEALTPHQWISSEKVKNAEPHFLPNEKCGAYAYSDCVMDDARLVLENLLDATAHGAEVHNYHTFTGYEIANRSATGRNLEVTIHNRLEQKDQVLHCDKIAFALGPFTDGVLQKLFPGIKSQLRLSQGIHLMVEPLPSKDCFILPIPKSKRYFFIVPWKGVHLIGTTETELEKATEYPQAFENEIQALLSWTQQYFPNQKINPICTITGIRPLAKAKGFGTSALSREQVFHTLSENIFSAVGGKYTTHRHFAEGYLQVILGKKNLPNLAEHKLPGAWENTEAKEALLKQLQSYAFVNPEMAHKWLHRYGKRSLELADFINGQKEYAEVLSVTDHLLKGEVYFSIHKEFAKCALDFFRRRTDIYFTKEGGLPALKAVEAIFHTEIPGSSQSQFLAYTGYLKRNHHRAII